uniref:Uncharacterized protein n=1 Tax=Tanacetum cinerariifolium TaxID=118510 RepID=A0A699H186_TANCI|nr:hypothetical protein [Tanacetum cinerariifolium]
MERNIQLVSTGLPSTLDEGTRKSQPLHEGTNIDSKDSMGNKQPIDTELPSMTFDEGTTKTTPRLEGSLRDKDSWENIPLADMEPIHPTVADLLGASAKYQVNETQSSRLRYRSMTKNKGKTSSKVEPDTKPLQLQTLADVQAFILSEDELINKVMKNKCLLLGRTWMRILRDQTDKLVEATISTLNRSSTTIQDLYKGLNVTTQLFKDINAAIKDDPATNKKINEAIETFANILPIPLRIMLSKEETSAAWAKSSTNMAWNLGSRMVVIEISQTALKREVFSLRQDTLKIKSMMTGIYHAFKGQSSLAPFSIPPTQAQPITIITTHPESSQAAPKTDKGKGVATESNEDPLKLVHASIIVRPDLNEGVKVRYMINRKMYYLTNTKMQAYLDKEEKLKKTDEESRLMAISKHEVIKVMQEEAEKIGLDPKKIASSKAGKKFEKAQDSEHQVLKRKDSKKVKRLTELNKKRVEQYMWTMINRIKPETITDVKIYCNTKHVVLSIYMNNNKRNFDVYDPFKFTDFRITKLGQIIQKKKNFIVKDLMTSLSKRYERLKKFFEELRIQPAQPASVPEQASSQTLGRKRKHMELEPEDKVLGLECNQSLPKVFHLLTIWSSKSLNMGSSSRMYLVIMHSKDRMISTRLEQILLYCTWRWTQRSRLKRMKDSP